MRMPADKAAKIECIDRKRIGCRVIDVSSGGACLEFAPEVAPPEQFQIVLDAYYTAACRVMWRHQNKLGVAFG